MTTPRTIDSYGGVFTDEEPVMNPTTEQSAAFGTRQMEDTAQMTMTTGKTLVRFPTTLVAAPVAVTPSSGRSQMGDDGAALPTGAKAGTGLYTLPCVPMILRTPRTSLSRSAAGALSRSPLPGSCKSRKRRTC